MEQTYQLKNDEPKEKINLKFTAYSKNLKQNLETLFNELNRMDFITNKQMYDDALKLFYIEIKAANKGYLIFVTDEVGNQVRYPIKMSEFEERPRFYQSNRKVEKIDTSYSYTIEKSGKTINNYKGNSRMVVDLLRLIPNYSDTNGFQKKKRMINKRRIGQRR